MADEEKAVKPKKRPATPAEIAEMFGMKLPPSQKRKKRRKKKEVV